MKIVTRQTADKQTLDRCRVSMQTTDNNNQAVDSGHKVKTMQTETLANHADRITHRHEKQRRQSRRKVKATKTEQQTQGESNADRTAEADKSIEIRQRQTKRYYI